MAKNETKKEMSEAELAREKARKKEERKREKAAKKAALKQYSTSPEAKETGDVNDDGKLIRVPTAWDREKHLRVTRGEFVTETVFYEMRVTQMRDAAQRIAERAEQMQDQVNAMKEAGDDPAKAALLKRRAKILNELAELDAELAGGGEAEDEDDG